MRHAKIFSLLVFGIVLTYGAIGFYFLPLATFQAELTRMALLPEAQFGWTKAQPLLDAKWMRQATLQEADVLIIGDSFSDGRVWQSVLTQRGLKVRTESWDSMRGVCADLIPWLRAQGFNGKYLVMESIERNLVDILSRSVACSRMEYHANPHTDTPRGVPPMSFDVQQGNYSGKLSTGIQTQFNVLKYERLSDAPDFKTWLLPNEVKMARITNGCELFSHASCRDALFLSHDKPQEIDAGALENIAKLNARLSGITPIWVFVPNKSTSYLYPEKTFWNEAERRFHAPNLLRMTQQAITNKTVDLYPANNTHFSTTGYLMMGEEIYKAMQSPR